MLASVIASVALLGATASATGSAYVVNKCSYPVTLAAVPASGGGYQESTESLASGASWSQDWTQLSNGAGWSIKLSQTDSLENILQYEYTWQNDGTIWYDLSCVNGNPWDGNWEITASGDDCSPRQAAYRYATDDAYGMQSCSGDSSITVTLCSGEAGDNSSSGSAASSVASVVTSVAQAAPSSASAAAPVIGQPAGVTPIAYNWNNADVSKSLAPTPVPTTLATLVHAAAVDADGDIVNMIETVWVTDTVTQYAKPKRHEHHPHHRQN